MVEHINKSQAEAFEALSKVNRPYSITFGNIHGYSSGSTEEGTRVANRHKKPATLFQREMLNTQKSLRSVEKNVRELQARYPALKTVPTVPHTPSRRRRTRQPGK